tara:strand:- start:164 stop:1798 length:1635 start_codon:yes stop_codon:yes gene_type:complete
MAKQSISIGSSANDGTGTSLRDGGDLINDNFNEIYNIIGDGSTLSLSSLSLTTPAIDTITRTGDFLIDTSGNITLDAGGSSINLKDDGTQFGALAKNGNDLRVISSVSDGDIVFRGNDGGSFLNALCLDMSDAGRAVFNAEVSVGTLTVRGGHVSLPGQLAVSGVLNATAGLTTDNLTIVNGGNEIDVSSGDLTLDVAGQINLDADSNGLVTINDDGTQIGSFFKTASTFSIKSDIQDKRLEIKGNDGGSEVVAVAFHMANAGAAVFNSTIAATGLTINSAYTFPTADGSANQILQTDGSGNLSFASSTAIPHKIGGANFADSILIGHSTTGTLNNAQRNIGIGTTALCSLVTADHNVAMGFGAMSALASGNQNVGIGQDALTVNNSGSENTAVGGRSSRLLANGTGNTTLGYNSGTAMNSADADYNVLIGHSAGANITEGAGNVMIGSVDADSATGDRQLKIVGFDGTSTTTWIKGTSAGAITFNSAYTFPTADGNANEVLTTDGSGALTYSKVSSSNLTSSVSLQIIDSTGSVLKTIHGAGS